jgi:anti-anti-sigma regulatory factor
MLKIQRNANGDVVFTVAGRLELDNADELFGLLATEPARRSIVLDLKDLVLIGREGVRLLRRCEAEGIVLRNCPPYIRAWMTGGQEQDSGYG